MSFQILGTLNLTNGRDVAVLPPAKPTILLAALLLHPNTVVSVDSLLGAIWGEQQPASAKAALQTCVLRLRRLFAKHGIAGNAIESVPGGYRVVADAETLDLLRFRRLIRRAGQETDPESELHSLTEGLGLWRGALLANVPSDVLCRDEVPRLTEEWLRASERVHDLKLLLGRCREVLPDLWRTARSYPGHERFAEQLIEALYRTGRQTEALIEYRNVKQYLLAELGLDPGPSLQRLEVAILRGDELTPGGAAGDGPVVTGHAARTAGTPPLTASPPMATSDFTGRAADVTLLTRWLGDDRPGPRTIVLTGAPGIGKTALALHVADQLRARFAAGRATLRMRRPDGTPRTPAELTAELVRLRVAGAQDPALLILDDVLDAEQIRGLLPVEAGRRVLITSRMSLTGLVATHGGRVHRLDPFTDDEAVELLTVLLGPDRAATEPDAVRQLAALCGNFPLALRIMAAQLQVRPRTRIADCVTWLRGDRFARMSLIDDPRMSITGTFGAWLDELDPRLSDALVRIARCAYQESMSLADLAGVLDRPVPAAGQILELLADAGALEGGSGTYTMHELVRAFAVDGYGERSTALAV
ncbi:BTAD domain-containing putative transcriptional regulator [Micromonospora sp. NBC_01813]|uniref:BTAD domain-containing putative transcriptional regulator n=1 Tax=Micromonospora sp. NBC_01813 TaxID=2975988 RepID=UPI002DDC0217|nr:BTAD domain-containing putative transcriptional regulator [Micromonospora sp. NBC_01813]WSA07806.1 NB-ARC domain-containing protein [Micromonospora sp. NBC_01813]